MRRIVFLAVALFLVSSVVHAQSLLQCDNGTVQRGSTKGQVYLACGAPSFIDKTAYPNVEGETMAEEIVVYDKPGFKAVIYFANQILVGWEKK